MNEKCQPQRFLRSTNVQIVKGTAKPPAASGHRLTPVAGVEEDTRRSHARTCRSGYRTSKASSRKTASRLPLPPQPVMSMISTSIVESTVPFCRIGRVMKMLA